MIELETPFSVQYPPTPIKIPTYALPLFFEDNITEKEVQITIRNISTVLFFQYNSIDTNIYLSCYSSDKNKIYFGGYRCVFGAYINKFDNGFPYMFFFKDNSGKNYEQIDFIALNNGVNLYAKLR